MSRLNKTNRETILSNAQNLWIKTQDAEAKYSELVEAARNTYICLWNYVTGEDHNEILKNFKTARSAMFGRHPELVAHTYVNLNGTDSLGSTSIADTSHITTDYVRANTLKNKIFEVPHRHAPHWEINYKFQESVLLYPQNTKATEKVDGMLALVNHSTTKDYLAKFRAYLRLGEQYHVLTNEVITTLKSVGTIPRLLKVWPEAKELLPPEPEKKQLPAIPVESLNTSLGLPTE